MFFKVLKDGDELRCYGCYIILWNLDLLVDIGEEVLPSKVIYDKVDLIVVFDNLLHFVDVWMIYHLGQVCLLLDHFKNLRLYFMLSEYFDCL